jgi:hypothetical protein
MESVMDNLCGTCSTDQHCCTWLNGLMLTGPSMKHTLRITGEPSRAAVQWYLHRNAREWCSLSALESWQLRYLHEPADRLPAYIPT